MTSMFTSIFGGRNPIANFPFEVSDDLLAEDPETYIWTIKHAKRKVPIGSHDTATAFGLNISAMNGAEADIARATVKRLKTLRHPNILTFVDSLEAEKVIYLVTEPCVPLPKYLSDRKFSKDQKIAAAAWGIYQITNAIKFLTQEARMIHNNICAASVFVTPSGEWKLGGLEYLINLADQNSLGVSLPKKLYALEKYTAPEMKNGNVPKGDCWSCDMFGLGCLIWEVFNGTLPNQAALKGPKQMPKTLHSAYAPLIQPNPGKRLSPDDFLKECRKAPAGFMRNKFVDTLLFIEEFQLKDAREKTSFFNQLRENLDLFPEDVAKNKILPTLIQAFQYGDAGSSVLVSLFRLGKLLSDAEYQERIVPCIVRLFGSPDRATRVKLLEKIEDFVAHLSHNIVNEKIFANLVTGFMDTNPAVREATVKAMIHLAPKLNSQNLNVELMRHFARLQGKDDQPPIRTNTTICLGKIAPHLQPQSRSKILLSAFTRGMKDPFPAARVAAVLALSATQQFYTIQDIANRVLPALASSTVDPEKQVRDQAFKATRGFLEKLERASENPEIIPQLEAEVNAGGGGILSSENVPHWASWALGALSGKFYKTTPPPAGSATDVDTATNSQPSTSGNIGELSARNKESLTPPIRDSGCDQKTDSARTAGKSTDTWSNDADGWGKLDEDESDLAGDGWSEPSEQRGGEKTAPVGQKKNDFGQNEETSAWDEDDTEELEGWDDLEPTPEPAAPKVSKPTSSNLGSAGHNRGMKLGGSSKFQHSNQTDDATLDALLGVPSSARAGKSGPASSRAGNSVPFSGNSGSSSERPFGAQLAKDSDRISQSTAFGPTGPIRTTLDKKKGNFAPVQSSDGWGDEDWGTGGSVEQNTDTDGWAENEWGDAHLTTSPDDKKARAAARAEERRKEVEKRRQAKQQQAGKLGARKIT